MTAREARSLQEAALRAIDARLAREPDAVEARFERAGLLSALGRTDDAREEYLRVLQRAPAHFGALNDLGTLLFTTGYRRAARTAYERAVALHPSQPKSRVNLANLLLDDGEVEAARLHYEAALQAEPTLSEAHHGMARVLAELGDEDAAERHRRLAFEGRAIVSLPYRGEAAPVQVLLLVSARGGNLPTRLLLDDRVFETTALVAEYVDPATALPPHQIVFNAVGDADLCRPALEAAAAIAARTTAPVVNPPAAVLPTGRVENSRRLASLPGVVAPRMAMLERASLQRPDAAATLLEHGLDFPLLLRSPGFHTGRHFLRVERAEELAAAVASLPGAELAAIEYLDATEGDGRARKYRVMFVDGRLYPLHLAVSANWKVHYFTADMTDHPEYRAEEAAFLADMPGRIGVIAMRALEQIRDRLGLDYAGVDFGLNNRGELLLFEANATMVVNPPEPDERWAHRRAPVDRVLAAVREMVVKRAAGRP